MEISTIRDLVFISFIVILSSISYVRSIGFYSDDWSILASLSLSQEKSLIGLTRSVTNSNTYMRPVQNIFDASLFWIFGANTFAYQIINLIVFILNIELLYILLKKLNQPRSVSLTIAVIYALLPNYSTDRFWFAAFQANISVLFYLLSFNFTLMQIRSKENAFVLSAASILSLGISALAYEVVLPLYIFNILVIALEAKRQQPSFSLKKKTKELSLMVALSVVVFSLFIFKALTTTRLENGPLDNLVHYPGYLFYILSSAIKMNFFSLIFNFIRIWTNTSFSSNIFLLSFSLGLSIFSYLSISFKEEDFKWTKATLNQLSFSGLYIFFLGYFIFFFNNNVGFSLITMDNRSAIAASLGIAVLTISLLGWISQMITSDQNRKFFLCFSTAFICMTGCLVVNTIAISWNLSWKVQKKVLERLHQAIPSLPSNSVVILDGVCPYQGPVVVFSARWDLRGAVQYMYKDKTLLGDVVSKKMTITENSLVTKSYHFVSEYPYKNIYIYNFETNKVITINNYQEAKQYFTNNESDLSNGCEDQQQSF